MIADFFSQLATGLTSFIPAFFSAIVQAFSILFMNATVTEGVTTYSGISPVGQLALAFIVIGIVYKIFTAICGWFGLGTKGKKKKTNTKRANARA